MYLNNYQYLKKKETIKFILLIFLSILLRIPIVLIFGDSSLENEWRVLVNNLIEHKTLAFDYLDPSLNKFLLPNIWMPPLYAYYLYFFSFFHLEYNQYILLILSSQILISSFTIVIFYKLNKFFFSENISFFSSILFSFFPLYLYACGQISSVVLQVFLTVLFFYLMFKYLVKKNFIYIFLFSFTAGALILLRGEFILILLLTLFYLFFYLKIKIKKILIICLIVLMTASPYLIRNIIVFDTIVITKSFGYNLWKGNNPNTRVEGGGIFDEKLKEKIQNIPKDNYYGINFDNIFFDRAVENIINEPIKYIILFFKKFISFIFLDIYSSKLDYYKPLHYLPILALSITSLLGIILSDKKSKKLNYLILIYLVTIIIFSFFFILPRYKLAIIPFQIIFTNVLLVYIKKKFFNFDEQQD